MRRIYLNAFYMDKFEVTVGQYARYLEVTDMEEPPDWNVMNQPQHQRRPVVNVDWEDAVKYCNGPASACRRKRSGKKRRVELMGASIPGAMKRRLDSTRIMEEMNGTTIRL